MSLQSYCVLQYEKYESNLLSCTCVKSKIRYSEFKIYEILDYQFENTDKIFNEDLV